MRTRVLAPLLDENPVLAERGFSSADVIQAGGQLVSYAEQVRRFRYAHDFKGGEWLIFIGFVTQRGAIFTVTGPDGIPLGLPGQSREPYPNGSALHLALTKCIDSCGDPEWCEHPRRLQLADIAAQIATHFTAHLVATTGPRRAD